MKIPTIPAAARKVLLDAALTTSGVWVTAKIALFVNNPGVLNNFIKWADFTEASFTGYAEVSAGTWLSSIIDQASGQVDATNSTNVEFLSSAAAPGVMVYGWALLTGTSPNQVLQFAQLFDAPVDFSNSGTAVIVTPVVSLPVTP